MRRLFYFLFLLVFITSCRQDSGERLFEMVYSNFTFTLPAGSSTFSTLVKPFPNVPTNISFYLNENGLDIEEITAITPFSARIVSLDGNRYDALSEASIRICNAGLDDCTFADEVFFIDNLFNRTGETINLLPGGRNAKRHLELNTMRIEVIFRFANINPVSIDSRLEIVFEAIR